MLQIISGKFFKSSDLYSTDAKGILYSNYSWGDSIKTNVVNIEPMDVYSSVSTYILSYKNEIEKGTILMRTGDYEILKQVKLISLFGLKSYFDIEKNNVQNLCRTERQFEGDNYFPSSYIRHFLDKRITGSKEEVYGFTELFNKIIDLKRETYKVIMLCLNTFDIAIKSLDQDINLSYSLLIYILETLSQNFDNYKTSWDDFDQNRKMKLEEYFNGVDPEKVINIKNTLIKDEHLKLTKRFLEFTKDHLSPDFFIAEAKGITPAICKTMLDQLLINAYNLRSGYVHNLKPILKQISISQIAKGEIFLWDNQIYLTFSGLFRLTHHVLRNFILKQPSVKTEDFDWKNDLPGIVTFELAPEFWISHHEGIKQEDSTKRFEGFLNQLVNKNITDIKELLKKYELLIPQAKEPYKIQMLSTYLLFNSLADQDHKVDGYKEFISSQEDIFSECTIESMLVHLIMDTNWPWTIEACDEVLSEYIKNRYKKKKNKYLVLPHKYELALYINLANRYMEKEIYDGHQKWLDIALYDLAGQIEMQNIIINAKKDASIVDVNIFLV